MAKYVIRQPRYLNGNYIHASGHEPKVVEIDLPNGVKPDAGLEPYHGSEPEPKSPEPHFQQVKQPHIETAANLQSKPIEEHTKHDEKHKGSKGRASDKDIA